jgi:gamma-glutamyltranspeptidase/glutathione hydrolase
MQDLEQYQVVRRKPLCFDYRGNRIVTNPAPSIGGTLIAFTLSLLESVDLDRYPADSVEHLQLLAHAMRLTQQLRHQESFDQHINSVYADNLVKGSLLENYRQILKQHAVFTRGTTHISIVDADNNFASMTLSNGEGSGYVLPGTGIMLNNMMGEDDLHPEGFFASPPAQRVASMLSPSVLLSGDGDRVRLVLGSGGSKRIRTALLQVISGVVDFDLGVRETIERPRLHWDESQVQVEPGFPPAVIRALRGRWSVNEWPERNLYFGGVHAVSPGGNGAGDPRRGGDAAVVDSPANRY